MAPLPTIGNCVRVALQWNSYSGVRPVNVFHLITSSTDEEEIGEQLDAAFADGDSDAFGGISSFYHPETYTITLLDGTSAGINVPADVSNGGLASGAPIPAVAAVLSFRTPQRGARGRGRLYLGPLSEGIVNNGLVEGTTVTQMRDGWANVQDYLASSSIAASFGVASYVHSEVNGVSSISMRQQCGTQRRRQDQLT